MVKNRNLTNEQRSTKLQVSGIERGSIVDGPGVRTVIFFSGCRHNCTKCHSKELQDFSAGQEISVQQLIDDLKQDIKFIDGITLSGGDPVEQFDGVIEFVKQIKKLYNIDVMLYTGYNIKDLEHKDLTDIDYIMDGKFKHNFPSKKNYRGSDNQKYYKNVGEGKWKVID